MRHSLTLAVLALAVPSYADTGISAEYLTTTVRTLPDGNEIRQEQVSAIAQDIHGRVQVAFDQRLSTLDLLDGSHWVANLADGTVTYTEISSLNPRESKRLNEVNRYLAGDLPDPPDWIPGTKRRVEDLGTLTISGLSSEGQRITHVIEAGALGNRDPIEVVVESWVSRDYGFPIQVRSVMTNPLAGTQTREIRNVEVLDRQALDRTFSLDPSWETVDKDRSGIPEFIPR